VHECGGLEGVIGALAAQARSSECPHLVVEQRHEARERGRAVLAVCRLQQVVAQRPRPSWANRGSLLRR
jgi:hypothetical protein